jgi:CheY-like chemotaxis protein
MPKEIIKKLKKESKSLEKYILWVEDEHMLAELYSEMIRIMGGIKVDFLELGQDAINRIKEIQEGKARKPDLVVLDLLLPDINGDKICEFLRKTPKTKDIKVFVLTNYGGEQMQEKMIKELKIEQYLIKTSWSPSSLMPLFKKTLGLK